MAPSKPQSQTKKLRPRKQANQTSTPLPDVSDRANAKTTKSSSKKSSKRKVAKISFSGEGKANYGPYDVLCGRGIGQALCSTRGNKTYTALIRSNRKAYDLSPRMKKSVICRKIVNRIYELGGQFLILDKQSEKWFDVGDERYVLPAHRRRLGCEADYMTHET